MRGGISDEERKQYLSDYEQQFFFKRMNPDSNRELFDDKEKSYSLFKSYYKRELKRFTENDTEEEFVAFTERHPKFIIKPLISSQGRGIEILDFTQLDQRIPLSALLKKYHGTSSAEELIVQRKELASLHPESLNTVRMATIQYDNHAEVIHAFLRAGRGVSVVDNAGSGGIICAVDLSTGKVTAACDESGKFYTIHPDSGIDLIGFEIPNWKQAKEFAEELARVIPTQRYVGWDIAFTDDGFVMVEGNFRGQWVWQYPEHKGAREEMNRIMDKLGV